MPLTSERSNSEKLEDRLHRKLSWRRRELVHMSTMIDEATGPWVRSLVRCAVLVLYSHFEGYFRDTCSAYLKFLNSERLRILEIKESLAAVALVPGINTCIKQGLTNRGLENLGQMLDADAIFYVDQKSVVDIGGNLSPSVIRRLLGMLCLNTAEFEIREHTVINPLLKHRNAISHGQGVDLKVSEYKRFQKEVLAMLDNLRGQVIDSTNQLQHLRYETTA